MFVLRQHECVWRLGKTLSFPTIYKLVYGGGQNDSNTRHTKQVSVVFVELAIKILN